MRTWAGAVFAVLALVGGAPAAAAPAPAPPRVTVLTDSVGGILYWDAAARDLLGRRLDLHVEQQSCRKLTEPGCPAYVIDAPESALAAVQRLGSGLGGIVVVNVGYNDAPDGYGERLDRVMAALVAAGVQHVIWVTLEEREGVWTQIDGEIRAAPTRWPQLVVADWARVAAGRDDWFVDDAHMNSAGGLAYAEFLRPFVLDACGEACAPPLVFCGLARTVNGFDPVSAADLPCGDALPLVAAVERGDRGAWSCSRAVNAAYELECRDGEAILHVLERSPVPAVRRASGAVRLANWVFRLHGRTLLAREDGQGRRWTTIGRPPFCVPAAPREVLVALRLRPRTPNGGCFTIR
ncbi:MAG: hypothetical protein ACJ77E_16070 [Gaiellaceae bacterium]